MHGYDPMALPVAISLLNKCACQTTTNGFWKLLSVAGRISGSVLLVGGTRILAKSLLPRATILHYV